MVQIVQTLTWGMLVDLFESAKKRIVIVMPAIHQEWVEAIKRTQRSSSFEIWICIDNTERPIRAGYGDIDSVHDLLKMNALVKQCKNLRLGFLVVDEIGFSFHLESRIIAGEPEGPNALLLQAEAIREILKTFFHEKFPDHSQSSNDQVAILLNNEELIEATHKLEANPPDHPDLQRQINTYTTLFQFAELHFEGGSFQSKTISIPTSALPFEDADLRDRIKSRINLFSKDVTDKWTELEQVKKAIEDIREKYLVPCNLRKKSVLRKEDKTSFQNELDEAKTLSTANLQKLQDKIQSAINVLEDTLRKELATYFAMHRPKSLEGLNDNNAMRQVEKEINTIVSKLKLPSASSLLSKAKIDVHFYELTVEDLRDVTFLKWFEEKELITKENEGALARFSKAYQTKP
jgi:hypothetical protein